MTDENFASFLERADRDARTLLRVSRIEELLEAMAPFTATLESALRTWRGASQSLDVEAITRLATELRDRAITNYPTDYEVSPEDLERIREKD